MNTQINTVKSYAKPELVSLGSAQQLTQATFKNGAGDQFNAILQALS